MSRKGGPEFLRDAFGRNKHTRLLEGYLRSCRPGAGGDPKDHGRFPNLAGFCRFLKIGTEELTALREEFPEACAYIYAVLEDEALNASLSPSLATAYLKRRLGYERESSDGERAPVEATQLAICFEHDIWQDGG